MILALDLFTAGLLNGSKVYVLAVTGHGTRRIRVLGATENPPQPWVVQQARNLLMDLEDAGTRMKFVLHDRDASWDLPQLKVQTSSLPPRHAPRSAICRYNFTAAGTLTWRLDE